MEDHLAASVSQQLGRVHFQDLLSMTVLFLPSALLLAPSNHLSALLLSPESALLTLGLLLEGEPLEASV